MTRNMFGDVVDPSITVGSSRRYTVPLSIAAHTMVIGALIIVPLAAFGALPTPPSLIPKYILVDPKPLPLPPPAAPRRPPEITSTQMSNPSAAPVVAPPDVRPEPDLQPRASRVGEVENGGGGDVLGGLTPPRALPPPPAREPVAAVSPVRPGGDIRQPVRIKDVAPVYPALAQAARIQGVVIIEATIDINGRVQDARILRSIQQLDGAALDAVRQWQYTPTLLNGMPVPVIITVTVNFKLN